MNPRNKVFLVLLAALAVMVIIACSCTDLIPSGGGDEAIPGLAGTWQDPETTDEFVIEWQNGKYVVSSVSYGSTSYSVTEQSWSGSSLTWTYYIPENDVSLSYETTSISGDSLYTNWWNSAGNSGTEVLGRLR